MDISPLQTIMADGYQKVCDFLKIIPAKKVVFKGFYSPEIYQEILSNQEILDNLKLNTPRLKKYFGEILQSLTLTKAGMALPAKRETWIIFNSFYVKFSEKWALDFVETVAHEVAHAVAFNWDIWRAHASPHTEITAYLKDYFLKTYDWKNILKGVQS